MVALFYIVAQAMLLIHLSHGLSSAFQSLGFRNHVWWPRIQIVTKAACIVIFIGYTVIPRYNLPSNGRRGIRRKQSPS